MRAYIYQLFTGKLAVAGGAREVRVRRKVSDRSRRVWLAFMTLTSFCARGHGNAEMVRMWMTDALLVHAGSEQKKNLFEGLLSCS